YEANSYKASVKHKPYLPSFQTDGTKVSPKNVILLISDGAGFSQIWAAATANGGMLNVTGLKQVGYSNTAAANDYNTDSAAGATAMSTGEKTNNRFIGMDKSGNKIANIIEMLSEKGIRCGIISNDKITGATPSSFFAHQTERDLSDKIAEDIINSPAMLIVGGYPKAFDDTTLSGKVKSSGFEVSAGLAELKNTPVNKRAICFENDAEDGSFRMIEPAFDIAVSRLKENGKKGFFLMVEGAKIDAGGHSNNVKQCIDEYLSFDRLVGKAIAFADQDKETLVIITSDHETGGLIIVDGNYDKGSVLSSFTTTDHTGLPVPLFSYGPGSTNFNGFLQNSDIPNKIISLIK
ncbi:MAG: alkaline phosphatase, partial [Pedobacter sp.]